MARLKPLSKMKDKETQTVSLPCGAVMTIKRLDQDGGFKILILDHTNGGFARAEPGVGMEDWTFDQELLVFLSAKSLPVLRRLLHGWEK